MIHAWEVQEKIYKAFSDDSPINLAIHFIQNIMEFFVDRHCLFPQLARTEQTCQVKETHISQSRNLLTMTVTIFVFRWIDKYFNFHCFNHFCQRFMIIKKWEKVSHMLISKIFLGNGFEDVERLQVARRLIRGRAGGGGKKTAVRGPGIRGTSSPPRYWVSSAETPTQSCVILTYQYGRSGYN